MNNLNTSIKEMTLPNGLKCILNIKPEAQSVSLHLVVKAGPRYESKGTSGIAHFLEHMLFEGTVALPSAKKLAEYIENVGGTSGAFTDKDYVEYYVKVLPGEVERAIRFLHDTLFQSTLLDENIQKEKGIVLEEMRRAEDNPEVEVWDIFYEWIFGKKQTLGRSTLGEKETISNFTRSKLISYLKKLYHTSNMVLAIVGNFSMQEVEKDVNKYFSNERRKHIPQSSNVALIKKKDNVHVIQSKTQQIQLIIGFTHTVTYWHKDRFPLLLLSSILGGTASSRIFQRLIYELGIAYSINCYNTISQDVGTFSIYGGVGEENIEIALKAIFEELSTIKNVKISEEELDFVKKKTKSNILFSTETTDALAGFYSRQLATENRILSLEAMSAEIDAVTVDDIQRVALKYLELSQLRLLLYGSIEREKISLIKKAVAEF